MLTSFLLPLLILAQVVTGLSITAITALIANRKP